MSQTTTMTIRLPADLRDSLGRLAKATKRAPSKIALDAIRSYVVHEEWQIAEIEAAIREADTGDFASDHEVNLVQTKWTSGC